MSKLVILDEYDANFDHIISPDYFRDCADEVIHYHYTSQEELLQHAAGADILITNKVIINEETIAQLPDLRYIAVLATGYNNIDVQAAGKAGIRVSNVPAYSTSSVVQLTFAHLLNLCRQVEHHAESDWSEAESFCYTLSPQTELDQLTFGILGYGDIGRQAALVAQAFRMNVIACTRTPSKINTPGVRAVDLDTLFRESDVLSLHCPQTPENMKIINRENLQKMKKTAILINTARGGLIDEHALAEALKNGTIAAAGLDVLSAEPPPPDHPLLHLPNCRITPHIAWITSAARKRLWHTVRQNIRSFIAGKPENIVNP